MSVDLPLARQPRLARLEVHGFKSFANRTRFVFLPGITAVVGPNGSGKSNVADAIRWVLGEQGGNALRAKKTDDVIFAGGHGRAPASVAEATLVFDNSERWLPSDFAEVAVTRRAERAGDNHYFINGRRVRLKDVALLTSSLGQSHVVVGQGLVDAALSQRPDERRGLFEHAADLAGLRLKVADAERNLNEAEANSARLHDLLTELEPRLRAMERAARQAREWRALRNELDALQRTHFRDLRRVADAALALAESGADAAAAALDAAQQETDRLDRAAREAASAAERARAILAGHDARRNETSDKLRRAAHERDLAAERAAALTRRRQDMADAQAGLEAQAAAVAADLERLAADLATLAAETDAARAQAAAAQRRAADARKRRAALEERAAALAERVAAHERQTADLLRQRALLEQRRETDAEEISRARAASAARAARIEALRAEMDDADNAAARDAAALDALAARLAERAAETETAWRVIAETDAAIADIERDLGAARGRLEALRRLHESGAGLFAGVREVLRTAREERLDGVLGTVAELLEVPADLDTAIEVALGGHVQDIVVRAWADAERAIAHLKRTGTGRATFQPIETVRVGRRDRPDALLRHPGVQGLASDLVRAAPDVETIVAALLGRIVVVADLPTARAVLPTLPAGWSAVTLAGEIARAGGSVTGGAAVNTSGALGRERELRTLPTAIANLERDAAAARERRAALADAARQAGDAARAIDAERTALTAAGGERARQQARLVRWLDDLRREQTADDKRLATLGARAEATAAERDETLARLDRSDAEAAALTAERDAARAELAQATVALEEDRAAADASQRVAALDERLRAERRREGALRNQERALADELTLRGERSAALDRERDGLAAQQCRLTGTHDALARDLAALDDARPPLERELRAAETAARRFAADLETARQAALDYERATHAAWLERERAQGEQRALLRRIADELEIDDAASLLADADDPSDPVAGDPATREREIVRLKERLRRIGYAGDDAVADYEREAERHEFLRAQLADVEEAAVRVRGLLLDLQRTMRQRFEETFARVAEVFADTFATLFGGGTARLVLTGGDDGAAEPGIDIVAQPPGKRLQNLALLSGGERALTAAALLFAILQVNPAPFCLLDEVDAALDEANVVRFREQLRALADQTQVIVVTHNRGTIETADTLYGVSMGADGVSQVLSLRLEDPAPAD